MQHYRSFPGQLRWAVTRFSSSVSWLSVWLFCLLQTNMSSLFSDAECWALATVAVACEICRINTFYLLCIDIQYLRQNSEQYCYVDFVVVCCLYIICLVKQLRRRMCRRTWIRWASHWSRWRLMWRMLRRTKQPSPTTSLSQLWLYPYRCWINAAAAAAAAAAAVFV